MQVNLAAAALIIAILSGSACTQVLKTEKPATVVEASVAALPNPLAAGWKGEKVCELLSENAHVRALRCTFPPGVGHERHFHAPHWGYILQGSTMRTTDMNGVLERVLQTGSTWWSDGIEWHEALNIGDQTSIYLIIEPKQAGSITKPAAT